MQINKPLHNSVIRWFNLPCLLRYLLACSLAQLVWELCTEGHKFKSPDLQYSDQHSPGYLTFLPQAIVLRSCSFFPLYITIICQGLGSPKVIQIFKEESLEGDKTATPFAYIYRDRYLPHFLSVLPISPWQPEICTLLMCVTPSRQLLSPYGLCAPSRDTTRLERVLFAEQPGHLTCQTVGGPVGVLQPSAPPMAKMP